MGTIQDAALITNRDFATPIVGAKNRKFKNVMARVSYGVFKYKIFWPFKFSSTTLTEFVNCHNIVCTCV